MKSIQKLGRIVLFCTSLIIVVLCPSLSRATPYASGITNSAGTIKFYLNEVANSVKVAFDNNTVTNDLTPLGETNVGLNSFSLGAHTNYSIIVTKIGAGAPTQISPTPTAGNASTNLAFNGPRGVAVNRSPKDNYFGRIYVVNASPGTYLRPVGKGIYTLNPDFSDALGYGNTAYPLAASFPSSGAQTWGGSTTYSPYRIWVGSDDTVYVGDSYYAAPNEPVWMIDPNLTTPIEMFNYIPSGPASGAANNGYAGPCTTEPVTSGSLAAGNLTLTCMMWDYYQTNVPNASFQEILQYNIGSGPINSGQPYVGTPTVLVTNTQPGFGTAGGINEVSCDLAVGPNGYIYVSYPRSATNGIPFGNNDLWVYDTNSPANLLWASSDPNTGGITNAAVSVDCFVNQGIALYGIAVSPDGKYLAGGNSGSANFVVVNLTNGVPDNSTIKKYTAPGASIRSVAFDAADNVYTVEGNSDSLRVYSLGLTTTATTYNDITGTNGAFQLVLPPTTVTVTAVTNFASQSGPTPGVFTLTRAGQSLNLPLTVNFSFGGTASNGVYTILPAGIVSATNNTITFAANSTTTNITIVPVVDNVARPTTTVVLQLAGGTGYTVATPASDTVMIQNTATPQLIASVGVPTMYNVFSNDYASFAITRIGNTNTSLTVSSFTLSGTAVAGVDYTLPGPITFNPGDLTYSNTISPLSNGQLPVDSTSNPYVGNKTVIVQIPGGSGFTGSTNTATLTILDSATPTATVLYADPLTDPNDATNWAVTSANNNMQTNGIDNTITFGYSLQNGDPSDYGAIPLPPSGATTALRVTVNKDSPQNQGASAGVNLYPTNVTFSGNYAVRFSMNLIQGYNPSYSTEGVLFGINHSGHATNWWTSGLVSGWGPASSETWESDGVWYWVNADTDYGGGTYLEFTGLGGTNNNTGWQQPATATTVPYQNAFKTNVFTGGVAWNPGLVSNGSVVNGSTANNWADVEIEQFNGVVTLSIDKTTIFTYTNTTVFTNGTLMLGYDDPFSSVGTLDSAVYFSNLRVVPIGSPVISQIALNNSNGTVVIRFSSTDGDLTTSSFTVSSASVVTGPYLPVSSASVTLLGGGAFQAVVPQNGAVQFYRILENN